MAEVDGKGTNFTSEFRPVDEEGAVLPHSVMVQVPQVDSISAKGAFIFQKELRLGYIDNYFIKIKKLKEGMEEVNRASLYWNC